MTTKHITIVTLKSKPERLADLTSTLHSVKTALPLVNGCEQVRILGHADDATSFTLIEDWQNKDHHAAHIDGLLASGAWAKIEAMLREPPSNLDLIEIEDTQ